VERSKQAEAEDEAQERGQDAVDEHPPTPERTSDEGADADDSKGDADDHVAADDAARSRWRSSSHRWPGHQPRKASWARRVSLACSIRATVALAPSMSWTGRRPAIFHEQGSAVGRQKVWRRRIETERAAQSGQTSESEAAQLRGSVKSNWSWGPVPMALSWSRVLWS